MMLAEMLKDTTTADQMNIAVFGVIALVVIVAVVIWVAITTWQEGE